MEMPDISAFLQFQFYKRLYYLDPSKKYPSTKYKPAQWLGVMHNVGDRMTFWLLNEETKQVIECSSVARAANVIDHTVQWDPALDSCNTTPPAPSHDLSWQPQPIYSSHAHTHHTRQSSKKQLCHAI